MKQEALIIPEPGLNAEDQRKYLEASLPGMRVLPSSNNFKETIVAGTQIIFGALSTAGFDVSMGSKVGNMFFELSKATGGYPDQIYGGLPHVLGYPLLCLATSYSAWIIARRIHDKSVHQNSVEQYMRSEYGPSN